MPPSEGLENGGPNHAHGGEEHQPPQHPVGGEPSRALFSSVGGVSGVGEGMSLVGVDDPNDFSWSMLCTHWKIRSMMDAMWRWLFVWLL